jgi:hypothetical protein
VVVTKVQGSGGAVTPATCKEQLLYEIHDPAAYITPDTVADFTGVGIEPAGPDRVAIDGATGRRRPDTLKVSLACRDGFVGEGQISYAGSGAVDRARLATEIVVQRLKHARVRPVEVRCDLIGMNSLHGSGVGDSIRPYEVRLRVVARTRSLADAQAVANEVESLYTNGPAGGGGATKSTRELLSLASALIPRELVQCRVRMGVV